MGKKESNINNGKVGDKGIDKKVMQQVTGEQFALLNMKIKVLSLYETRIWSDRKSHQ